MDQDNLHCVTRGEVKGQGCSAPFSVVVAGLAPNMPGTAGNPPPIGLKEKPVEVGRGPNEKGFDFPSSELVLATSQSSN